jgi:hypothetical protein
MGWWITSEGKPAKVDGGSYYTPRVGVVVVPKRRRDFGRNTLLTLRDLSDPFPSRKWANSGARQFASDHLCHTKKLRQLFENDIGGVPASERKIY